MTRSQTGLDHFPSQINRANGLPNGRAFTQNHPNKKFQSLEPHDWFEKHILTPLRHKMEFIDLVDKLNSKYPQGNFARNTTHQHQFPGFVEPLHVETDNLFGCIIFQCEHCLCFETHPFYFYDQCNIEPKTTKVDHVCPNNNPLMLARFLPDNEKKIFNANQTNLIHSMLKSMVLNQWIDNYILYLYLRSNCLIPTQK
jgi:hypothetical protein